MLATHCLQKQCLKKLKIEHFTDKTTPFQFDKILQSGNLTISSYQCKRLIQSFPDVKEFGNNILFLSW